MLNLWPWPLTFTAACSWHVVLCGFTHPNSSKSLALYVIYLPTYLQHHCRVYRQVRPSLHWLWHILCLSFAQPNHLLTFDLMALRYIKIHLLHTWASDTKCPEFCVLAAVMVLSDTSSLYDVHKVTSISGWFLCIRRQLVFITSCCCWWSRIRAVVMATEPLLVKPH